MVWSPCHNSDASVIEGNAGTTNAIFTVSLTFAAMDDGTVQSATVDGTATAKKEKEKRKDVPLRVKCRRG